MATMRACWKNLELDAFRFFQDHKQLSESGLLTLYILEVGHSLYNQPGSKWK